MTLDRRTFISAAATTLVSAKLFAHQTGQSGQPVGGVLPTKGPMTEKPLPTNEPRSGKYRPGTRLGLGGVAIGNGFAPITDAQSDATMQTAWDAGVRFFDTSPFYGFGLSERRMGRFLHNRKPEEYVLATKIGRVFRATKPIADAGLWKSPSPFAYTYDYTAAGTRRSVEDSLQRLGVSRIDIVFIHDLSPDTGDFGRPWTEVFEEAAKGAMPELTKMREEGLIKAWGFGVNRPDPALRAIEIADPDIFLLATQYSLIDHQEALDKTFPALEKKGVSVVVGAPLNAGFLAGRDRYHYGGNFPAGVKEKRQKITAVCDKHGVDLRTVALQFTTAHPVVSATIPGARSPEQVAANASSMKVDIPSALWSDLKQEGLIAGNAPTPKA